LVNIFLASAICLLNEWHKNKNNSRTAQAFDMNCGRIIIFASNNLSDINFDNIQVRISRIKLM